MLTIEHVDSVHIHLPAARSTILSEAIAAGLRQAGAAEQTAGPGTMQTSATLHGAPPALGERWPGQGGYYVGTMPARIGHPGYHLVLAANGRNSAIAFGPYDHDVAGAVDHYDGQANTRALTADAKEHPAAKFAASITEEGHEDYYLPAHNELMLMWISVPNLFFKEGYHWSSTQYSPDFAWAQDFEYGISTIDYKYYEFRAVAVRRFVL